MEQHYICFEQFKNRKNKMKEMRKENIKRQLVKTDTMDAMKRRYSSMYAFFLSSKSLLKAWFEISKDHTTYEFMCGLIYFTLYFFCFGYFTNFLLFRYKETDRPKYMARLYGFYGWNRNVLWNQVLWFVGLIVTTYLMGGNQLPAIYIYTVSYLLITYIL